MSFHAWSARLLQQVRGVNPFGGDSPPTRVSLFGFGRPSLPFPHLWNYKEPLKIFETFYWEAEKESGSGKHNRYLYVAGLPPMLLSRDPAIIKAVLAATGGKPGQFDRDAAPTAGIARAVRGMTPFCWMMVRTEVGLTLRRRAISWPSIPSW